MHDVDDTIAAIASASGGAVRGIIRISGPQSTAFALACFEPNDLTVLPFSNASTVVSGQLVLNSPLGAVPCDAYVWPTERSYTQQPTVELHTIGSAPILEAGLALVCRFGARLAEPGEFTMRAFLAGRLDLTQAEAVLGVIDATSRSELDAALSQLAGGLAGPLSSLRDRLIDLLAHLEAGLDFVEEDIEFIKADDLVQQLDQATSEIEAIRAQLDRRAEAAELPKVALVGYPNVGKSSLLNALACDSAAIVSATAGTTRDYVSRRVSLGDTDAVIVDTAGVEAVSSAGLAAAAQEMTADQQQQAAFELFCIDATRPLNAWETSELAKETARRLVVLTKSDLATQTRTLPVAISTSSVTGEGVESLRTAIGEMLSNARSTAVVGTAVRCRDSLRLADASLRRSRDIAARSLGEELVAAEIRVALDELGKVVGQVYTDDILDRIFSQFCIGK
jgi:tRNA modification GTPase